jgi:hypothetical protein
LEIKNHVDVEKNFEFQHITSDKIEKIIDKINIKKASGFDNIPAKVIKQCKPIISNQLTSLINLSIDTGVFPDSLKKAQVTPLHKKNDPLSKTNYSPVSVLPVFSKIFEKVFETQLSDFFDTIFPMFLCCDFLYIGSKTYVFCIWLLLIHCSYTEVDFYGVVYFSLERVYQVHF